MGTPKRAGLDESYRRSEGASAPRESESEQWWHRPWLAVVIGFLAGTIGLHAFYELLERLPEPREQPCSTVPYGVGERPGCVQVLRP